jgi:Ferritin-like domain
MASARSIRSHRRWRFAARVGLLLLALTLLGSGCGKPGQGAKTDPEKGSDAKLLNLALGQELTLLDAYTLGMPRMRKGFVPAARRLRAQKQEYVSAISKAIRGLGGEAIAEPSALDPADLRTQADVLTLAYELESTALASDLDAVPRLFMEAPRTLAAALAAGHAQHLVVLRQGLGVDPAAAIPEAFDGGEVPPPGGGAPPVEG